MDDWLAGWVDGWLWQRTWCNSIGAESLTICQNSQASEFQLRWGIRLEFSRLGSASLATLRWSLCVGKFIKLLNI